MGPIFIIGGSRTGSELLKNFFRKLTVVDMIPEMFLLCPKWLHEDFAGNVQKHLGGFGDQCDPDALIDLMYSKKLYGQFWSVIDALDKDALRQKLVEKGCSLQGVFAALLELHAETNGKKIQGAKFPVHYSQADKLIEWFPDCKLIHTVRDPRAIYSSQSSKYTKDSYSMSRNAWVRARQFLHITIQSEWTARIHERLQKNANYHLLRYEDLILHSGPSLMSICQFVGIQYEGTMENPALYNSNTSFGQAGASGVGFDKGPLESWNKRIHPFTAGLIRVLNARAMRNFGYNAKQPLSEPKKV